jgi:hypothetical protein
VKKNNNSKTKKISVNPFLKVKREKTPSALTDKNMAKKVMTKTNEESYLLFSYISLLIV